MTPEGSDQTTVALSGNTFISQRVHGLRETRFLDLVDHLRSADVTLTNLECAIPERETPPAFVAGSGWGATYMAGTPEMIDDLRFMGIDGVCAANNHVSDFGDGGILSTMDALRSRQMPFAGIGASLTEASQASYITASTGLRVAFLAACDWGPRGSQGLNFPWPQGYLASDEVPPFVSRPGVNLLRYESESLVSVELLEQLRGISRGLGWDQDKVYRRHGWRRSHPLVGSATNLGVEEDSESELWFLGRKFVAADGFGHRTVPCHEDLDRLYKHVREARRQADVVCVALHDQSHGEDIHDYIDVFAHGAIDMGADVVFNNGGTHGAVEIYRGGAILYGVPGLFLQTEAVSHVPADALARFGLSTGATASDFLDARAAGSRRALEEGGGMEAVSAAPKGSAVYTCVFDDQGDLEEVRIQPIEPMGGTLFNPDAKRNVPRFRQQLPLLADDGHLVSESVLGYIAQASTRFGVEVARRDGVGIIRVK